MNPYPIIIKTNSIGSYSPIFIRNINPPINNNATMGQTTSRHLYEFCFPGLD